jgi:hypothetical protein
MPTASAPTLRVCSQAERWWRRTLHFKYNLLQAGATHLAVCCIAMTFMPFSFAASPSPTSRVEPRRSYDEPMRT